MILIYYLSCTVACTVMVSTLGCRFRSHVQALSRHHIVFLDRTLCSNSISLHLGEMYAVHCIWVLVNYWWGGRDGGGNPAMD